jgi:hypothetical protein
MHADVSGDFLRILSEIEQLYSMVEEVEKV